MKRHTFGFIFICAALIAAGMFGNGGTAGAESAPALSDISGHWGKEAIAWAVEAGVVNGYPDGTFRPDSSVTEAQFIAMLFRSFPQQTPAESPPYWYSAYYDAAEAWHWPVDETNANRAIRRGEVASIVSASLGKQLPPEEAAQYLLDIELAHGRLMPDGTVDFGVGLMLTRAEAVQFIQNVAFAEHAIGPADKRPQEQAATTNAPVTVSGIAIGDSLQRVTAVMGAPARKDLSEYGFEWYVYNQDYTAFSMIGVKDGKVTALYANGSSLAVKGIKPGAKIAEVRMALGEPLRYILKDNTRYMLSSDGEFDVFALDSAYVTVFYDQHEDNVVSGVQAVLKQTEESLPGYYGTPSDRLAESFEREALDLANSARVKFGLPALQWEEEAAAVAEKHSKDMAVNQFFDHTNLRGEDLGDRLEQANVRYLSAGENIAYGQSSAIFAHEGWMNSTTGHRENILHDFEQLGVGVVFSKESVPYYTQNFIRR